ncbi:MAG: trimeric intracellular cation channel family protein [Bdellovibrio sp.]|nr:trimeric intracellular cation channel family protein [Methylotenera sp.]
MLSFSHSIAQSIEVVELLGVLAFAFTGIIEARKKAMDLIGVYTVSMMAAFGGGTIRDLLIGNYPLYWITHSGYALTLLGFALASSLLGAAFYDNKLVNNAFEVFDTLGLGLFATVGANIAQQSGCDFYISLLLGTVTAVFGGVLRDIVCNEIPKVFHRNELYATCALAGSFVFLVSIQFGLANLAAMLFGVLATVLLRYFAMKYRIRLPF